MNINLDEFVYCNKCNELIRNCEHQIIMCEICRTIFKDSEKAQEHSNKTQHELFSKNTPTAKLEDLN